MVIKKRSLNKVTDKLTSYAILQKNIEFIEKQIKLIDGELFKIKTSKIEEGRGGGVNCRLERLMDEKTKLNNKLKDLKLDKKIITESVNLLSGIEKEVIIDFYFKKKNIPQIAKKTKYSEAHIRRLRSNAVTRLEQMLK